MEKFEENIRKTVPYVPGEQPQARVIKLNTNENPYPPAPAVADILQQFPAEQLRRYPDPTAAKLIGALAREYGVGEANIFAGVGSDDVLAMAFLTFFNGPQPLLFPDVTYSFYKVWAALYDIPYRKVPLREDFTIDTADYERPNGGIIIPNPNAPTGLYEPLDSLERLLQANRDVVVIIDEAYVDFAGPSAIPLTARYENLLVVQTFSKSRALAGLRVGFAVGSEKLIRYLNDAKYSFNSYTLNALTIECAAASLTAPEYFAAQVAKIKATREWAQSEFIRLGFTVTASQANFLFVKPPRLSGREVFTALRDRDIYVRRWDEERIKDYLRVTVGTREEMTALFAALTQILL